jgi:hypothetical protein
MVGMCDEVRPQRGDPNAGPSLEQRVPDGIHFVPPDVLPGALMANEVVRQEAVRVDQREVADPERQVRISVAIRLFR